tara:strand:- start:486 stop:1514 length:1029 start_codon:yes stop_codon:yes gene_type:complete
MKKLKNLNKKNFIQKIFVKLCRIIGFEIIDQSNLYIPTKNKSATENLSDLGKKTISIPLGVTSITRKVESLDIIIKSCTSVNLVTQNKKRIFEKEKSEYTFRTLNSLLKSLAFGKKYFKEIKIKIYLIDYNSPKKDLDLIKELLVKSSVEYEILNLNVDDFAHIKIIKKNNEVIENNMRATMASILTSFKIAKEKVNDLVYFVEDDYIHKKESIFEMLSSYEKISSDLKRELFICPIDYPYLYSKLEESNIIIGGNYHWRTIKESLLTFLTSKSLLLKYWDDLKLMSENEHSPFEAPLHKIYEKETCISPIPSLAMHCTNINSIFGLSPNINWKKLWEENEI